MINNFYMVRQKLWELFLIFLINFLIFKKDVLKNNRKQSYQLELSILVNSFKALFDEQLIKINNNMIQKNRKKHQGECDMAYFVSHFPFSHFYFIFYFLFKIKKNQLRKSNKVLIYKIKLRLLFFLKKSLFSKRFTIHIK